MAMRSLQNGRSRSSYLVSLAIGFWEHQKAKLAKARLESLVGTLPETLLDGVRQVLMPQGSSEASGTDGVRSRSHTREMDQGGV